MTSVGTYSYNSESGPDNLFFVDLRVYIAGVLIPTNAVYITSSFSNLPTCSITLPPYKELFSIGRLDRVPVHVFMVNKFRRDSAEDYSNMETPNSTLKCPIGEPVLIFEGEIVHYGYQSDSDSRNFIINASSHLTFLKDLRINYLLTSDEIIKVNLPGESISKLHLAVATKTSFPLVLFTHGFTLGGLEGKSILYPSELLENVSTLLTDAPSSVINNKSILYQFYQQYTKDRLKLPNRIPIVPYFDKDPVSGESFKDFPLWKFLQTDQVLVMINSFLSEGFSSEGSLWDMIFAVFRKMEYDLCVLSSPTYNPTTGKLNSLIAKPLLYDAIPPKSNIIFRNQIKSIRVDETVKDVPTRIRLMDIYKTLITPTSTSDFNDLLRRINYWPSSYIGDPATAPATSIDSFSSELLEAEKYTGPYLYDTQAPPWTSYADTNQFPGTTLTNKMGAFKQSLMKSMLMLKRYEHRQITVVMDFNPFIIVGAPAIIFDVIPNGSDTPGLVFIGYVLSSQHSITKNSMRTNVTLGFTRIIQEDFKEDTRLFNAYSPISTNLTHNHAKMSEVYRSLFGCEAISAMATSTSIDPGTGEQVTDAPSNIYQNFYDKYYTAEPGGIQDNPKTSYEFNERRLCTFNEYLEFMNLFAPLGDRNDDGDLICKQFTDNPGEGGGGEGVLNGYISGRNDPLLIRALLDIQDACSSNKVYNKI